MKHFSFFLNHLLLNKRLLILVLICSALLYFDIKQLLKNFGPMCFPLFGFPRISLTKQLKDL